MRVDGKVNGKDGGSATIYVLIYITYVNFMERNGKFRPCLTALTIHVCRTRISSRRTMDMWEDLLQFTWTQNGVYSICEEMLRFTFSIRNPAGRWLMSVQPFDPVFYWVAVHSDACLVFTPNWSQFILLQHLVDQMQLLPQPTRYWPNANGSLILKEWGRWRSRFTLEWLQASNFESVPEDIKMEIMQRCNQHVAGMLSTEPSLC